MTRRHLGLLGVTAVAYAWVSSGVQPLTAAVADARAPIDFVRSFVAARALAHGDRRYAVDADARNLEATAISAPIVPVHEGPYLPHPPPAVLLVVPLVPLGFAGASLFWLGLSVGCAVWLARFLVRLAGATSTAAAAGGALLLLLWPPFLHNIEKGQWSILLAALMAAGWRDLSNGRTARSGVWFALAASLKVTPGLMLPLVAMRARPAARTMVITLGAIAAATLPAVGLTGWRLFIETSDDNVRALETWLANSASLHGFYARLFSGGQYARPLLLAPALARALSAASSAGLLAIAAVVTYRNRRRDDADDALFAMWTSLAVLLNPLAWSHALILLLLPITLLGRRCARQQTIFLAGGVWVALALISIPRWTLYRWAGDLPVPPLGGLPVALHASGALTVFAVAALSTGRASWHSGEMTSRERPPERG